VIFAKNLENRFAERVHAEAQRGKAATKTKPGNLNREICERREKQKDAEISRGDAPPSLKLRRTGENAEKKKQNDSNDLTAWEKGTNRIFPKMTSSFAITLRRSKHSGEKRD
jgi:hypothetical protein